MHALTLRSGPDALRLLRERGVRVEDVDIVPAASGGPKWLAIAGLDRFLFGEFARYAAHPTDASDRIVDRQLAHGVSGAACNAGDVLPLRNLRDLPTTHVALTALNLRDALRASGSIAMVIDGVAIASAPGGLHWDGGVTDYHLDLDFEGEDGLVLYPHFSPYVIPGWFDKSLPWRRAGVSNFSRALLRAPSAEFVATLPGRRIPDRNGFFATSESGRICAWEQVRSASTAPGDELGELISSGRLADRVEAWT